LIGSNAMLVDSHCHLDFPDFAEDLDGIVARAETSNRRAVSERLLLGRHPSASRR
jgi:Tat protein secretion system quality control protein TatD with DNase activity